MARLVGVDLPREKRMEIALTYIFGIGRTKSSEILAATGVSPYLINKELKARAAHEAWAERKRQEVQRANAILGAWTQASDTERAMAVRAIGVVDVWNTIASIVA